MNIQKYKDQLDTYILMTDEIAVGAGKVMFDLFNNTAAISPPTTILILGWYVAPKTDVAVTGAVSARFDMYRTSTIGTGGTTASYNGGVPTAPTIVPMASGSPSLSGTQITARSAPTGGALKGAWLNSIYAFPEETNTAAIMQQYQNIMPDGPQVEPFRIGKGEGIVVQQGSVVSVSNFVFTIVFATVPAKG